MLPDGRLLVTQKGGAVRVVTATGTLLTTPLLTLPVDTASERGLIGIAAHPSFSTNGFLYLCVLVAGLCVCVCVYFSALPCVLDARECACARLLYFLNGTCVPTVRVGCVARGFHTTTVHCVFVLGRMSGFTQVPDRAGGGNCQAIQPRGAGDGGWGPRGAQLLVSAVPLGGPQRRQPQWWGTCFFCSRACVREVCPCVCVARVWVCVACGVCVCDHVPLRIWAF